MVYPQHLENIFRGLIGVNDVVHTQISTIAHEKSWQKSKNGVPHDQFKQKEQYYRDGGTHDGWHGKTIFVFRKIMMYAMHRVLDFLPGRGRRYHVEEVSMYEVFNQTKGDYSYEKQNNGQQCTDMAIADTPIHYTDSTGSQNTDWYQNVRSR